jgi:hypothetical protein
MSRQSVTTAVIAGLLIAFFLWSVGSAQAAFGARNFDSEFVNEDGSQATQAGSHSYAMRTTLALNERFDPTFGKEVPDGMLKDLVVDLPPGFAGTAVDIPRCQTAEFLEIFENRPNCSDSSAVGAAGTYISAGKIASPVFNLVPPPGVAVKLGYWVYSTPVTIEVGVSQTKPFNVSSTLANIPQTSPIYLGSLELWGVPAAAVHDPFRGHCLAGGATIGPGPLDVSFESFGICKTNAPEVPFFTLPRSCTGPVGTHYALDSWENPGRFLANGSPDLLDPSWISGEVFSHDTSQPPNPQGVTGCGRLGFKPHITAQPTTKAAQSPSGLDFSLNVNDEGLTSPSGLAQANISKVAVTLPEGFTTNPSLAEGLNVCTEADLARETLNGAPGTGCPNESKIGTVEVETPLLDENVNGALYIAKPYENEVGSLLALYMVIKNPTLGIMIKQAMKVENDPVTGRITTVAEDLPQLPFSHFKLHFREGTRSPLASPPLCGSYDVSALLTPSSGGPPVVSTDTFELISGPSAGPCPSGATPPFKPGLEAGTLNNAAGRYSPFYVHMTRNDGEQEITHFSIKLPPGVLGKLAGIPFCSDAAIAAAKARTGPHGGQEEIEHPSCPAASEVGHSLVGSGVGPSLAYAPGKIYLAGPYRGSALSMVAITAAKVGPFDLGTVVIRFAFKIDPETAEVFIDATGSDPIPHIIKGIPVHLRDIRAYVDRPEFVLNPTNCTRTSTASTVLGSGLDFGSEADDRPVTVSSPFQAADCAALPFKPRLSLKLKGGTRRGSHPALKATLDMNGIGEAGVHRAEVILPKSEFIENAHFNTICTRVVFKQGAHPGEMCPAGSVYGHAVARVPLLSEPLEGPVFLRSSEHQLPDVVASLHNGQIDVVLDGHVDSVKGRLRNTFESTPDAPVSSVVISLLGGKKGLFVNSTNLCKAPHKAEANFTGQNGKEWDFRPVMQATGCGKAKKKQKRSKRRAH